MLTDASPDDSSLSSGSFETCKQDVWYECEDEDDVEQTTTVKPTPAVETGDAGGSSSIACKAVLLIADIASDHEKIIHDFLVGNEKPMAKQSGAVEHFSANRFASALHGTQYFHMCDAEERDVTDPEVNEYDDVDFVAVALPMRIRLSTTSPAG